MSRPRAAKPPVPTVSNRAPHAVVVAGPNGAGKSTSAPALLQGALGVRDFVNADVIAQGLSAFESEAVSFQAGRIMLKRLRQLGLRRENFAFETTLATRSFAPWLAELKTTGYRLHLVFLSLPSAELSIERVAERVAAGGHHVPAATVRRRFQRGLQNLFTLYLPLMDSWRFYDNSCPDGPRLVASGVGSKAKQIADSSLWQAFVEDYGHA